MSISGILNPDFWNNKALCALGQNNAPNKGPKKIVNLSKYLPFYRYDEDHVFQIPYTENTFQQEIMTELALNKLNCFLTINPYDKCVSSSGKEWSSLSYTSQYNYINKVLLGYSKYYNKIYLCPEFSDKGRFHIHAFISFSSPSQKFLLLEKLNRCLSNRPNSKVNTKAIDFSTIKDSFTVIKTSKQSTTGINYLTKDMQIMYSMGFPPCIHYNKHIVNQKNI